MNLLTIFAAAWVVTWDPTSSPVPNRITRLIKRVDPASWAGVPNAAVNPALPTEGQPAHWKWDGSKLVPMTQGERDSITQAQIAARLADEKADLMAALENDRDRNRILVEAMVIVLVEQFNAVRTNSSVRPPITAKQARDAILAEYQTRVGALTAK